MLKKDYKDLNEFILAENDKYISACSFLAYHYLKSKKEVIKINQVASDMGDNVEENKIIIKRILNGLGKGHYLYSVKLTYSDYVKLQKIIRENKSFYFQLAPFIISVLAFAASILSIFLSFDESIYMNIFKIIFAGGLCIALYKLLNSIWKR